MDSRDEMLKDLGNRIVRMINKARLTPSEAIVLMTSMSLAAASQMMHAERGEFENKDD